MPRAPFKFYDSFGRLMTGPRISKAAIGSRQRGSIGNYDRDTPALYSGTDRRALMSIGRLMYDGNPVVHGIVDDMAEIISSELTSRYVGNDPVWGKLAEDWMLQHDAICDVRGELYPMRTLYRLWTAHTIRDGDVGVILTKGAGGYPLLQTIPAHRIRGDGMVVAPSPWSGYKLVDGVIINEVGRPLAYRVYEDGREAYTDISATDMKLRFRPMFADQLRGLSMLGSSLINFQDVDETRKFEMVAQKLAASIVLTETNELGTDMSTDSDVFDEAAAENTADFTTKTMEGGEVRYFRSGTGGKIEALRADRPTDNQQSFVNSVLRQAMAGVGWSIDYFLDPTKIGGASMRVAVERINRRVKGMRDDTLFPLAKMIDVWRLSVAIKLGLLPPTDDVFAWRYQGAAALTADKRYAADVMEKQLGLGLMSHQQAADEIGNDWETVIEEKAAFWAKVQEAAAQAGVDPSLIASMAEATPPAAVPPADPDAATPTAPGQPLPPAE